MIQFDTVISPCISICRLDNNDVCIGCFRSVDEIRKWYESTNDEKKQFIKNIEQRKKK